MTILIAVDTPKIRDFDAVLDANLLALPPASDTSGWSWADELEAWRETASQGPQIERIVVAVWPETPSPGAVVTLDAKGWEARTEQPLARWAVALGCAVARCADGGRIVSVVDGPTTLERSGWAFCHGGFRG